MSKDRIRQRRVESFKRSIWVTTGIAVLAAAVLIAMSPRALPSVTIPPRVDRPYANQDRTMGPENAPVLIEEYSDFQCPYCAQFALQTLPRLEETYIAGGQVRFVSHYFAFIGDESIRAAEAVECASEQSRTWDYIDTLWVNQHGENRGAFADSYLKSFAEGLGLNTLEFSTCLDTRRYRQTVMQETSEGRNRGVTSTPTFFINGKMITGAKSFDEFQQEIEAGLAGGG